MLVTPRGARAATFTRHGTGITDCLGDDLRGARRALAALTNRRAVLDGEFVRLAVGAAGPTGDFAAVGAALHSGQSAGAGLHYVVFDLLQLDGEDLRGRRWRDRDARLRELIAGAPPSITAIDTLRVTADVHHRVVALGFGARAQARRRLLPRRLLASVAEAQGTPPHHRPYPCDPVNADRGRLAVCDLHDGQQCWATARSAQPATPSPSPTPAGTPAEHPARRASYALNVEVVTGSSSVW
jgi:hypothetical protein